MKIARLDPMLRAMSQNEFFSAALQLPEPWHVVRSKLSLPGGAGWGEADREKLVLHIDIDFRRGARPRASSTCGRAARPRRSGSSGGRWPPGAPPGQVDILAMDMSPTYQKVTREHFPNARVAFDRWHVMKLAGEAVESVRKHVQCLGADLKGSVWVLRGNASRLGRARLAERQELHGAWCPGRAAAQRSRLPSFVALARTVRRHLDQILNYYPNFTTSAAIESTNNLIQTARRRARGYRNFENFRAIAYWMADRLDLKLPKLAHTC